MKIADVTKLAGLQVYSGINNLASYEAPIPAGGSGVNPGERGLNSNEWTWVFFSWGQPVDAAGTNNRAAIADIRIRASGSAAGSTTVEIAALASFPKQSTYPNGVVTFAFDDTFIDAYTKAGPKLDQ